MQKPIIELDPHWATDGSLLFDCPSCPMIAIENGSKSPMVPSHIIDVTTQRPLVEGGPIWEISGQVLAGSIDFSTLSLAPSIDYTRGDGVCMFHGWVRNGVVTW